MPFTQAGNLSNNLPNWREITGDPWVLETVSGYHLEFESLPYQSSLPKLPTFNEKEAELIELEINILVSKGAISEVCPCHNEFVSNIFLVPKKTGDFRPVINLKPLNQFVEKIHFKMENIHMALNSISPGDYMVSVDLKDAYFSIPIFQDHRKYLRFLWNSKRFEFTCLPFGYSLAPRVFTKIFKPVMAFFRFLGFRVTIFIDDSLLSLTSQARSDLHWVVDNISRFNGKSFKEPKIDVYIESDASLTGWGALCDGQSTNGRWSPGELDYHINYLELLAGFHALQCFVSCRRSIHVRLALDNSTAVAYVNNMGGTKSPSLDSLSKSLWEWCIARDILVSAQHIPGKANVRADALSREISSNLEWSLDSKVFCGIVSQTFVPEVDLFASRLNAKTDRFISWHPEPGAMAVDAFSLHWANMKCYAFPPFSLLPRVLSKIRNDEALVLLIAPVWPTQSWYPLLLQLLINQPIRLPRLDNLLTLPHSLEQHPLRNKLDLAAWTLSGKLSQTRDFRRNLLRSSVPHGQLALKNSTKECGTSGLAGVVKDRLIYFKPL